ncbi:MAG: hypothetical protein SGPRY_014344, partial [Prymnesium sp.]
APQLQSSSSAWAAGCVQEEIRFLISPELIVSRLLTEPLRDHEAMIMSGFERFCSYTGYASSFSFYQPYDDKVVLEGGRVKLVAIDATNFGRQAAACHLAGLSLTHALSSSATSRRLP